MALCPPNKGILAETSGWNKLVEKLREKYGENADRIAEYAFYQKGDMPTYAEAIGSLSKMEKKVLSNTVKSQIDKMVKEVSKKTKEMMGYSYGFAEGSLSGQIAGKREGRVEGVNLGEKQVKELQQEMSDRLKLYLKTNEQLVGRLSEKQVNAIIKRANELGYSEAKYNKLTQYIDKVIANENYQEDLSNGTSMQSRLTKPLSDAASLIKRMKSISLSDLTAKELMDYNSIAKAYLDSKKSISSSSYNPFNVAESEPVIAKIEQGLSQRRVEDIKNAYGVVDITEAEANVMDDYMMSENQDEFLANLEEAQKKQLRFNIEKIANYSLLGLKEKVTSEAPLLEAKFGKEFVQKLNRIANVDVSKIIDTNQLSELVKIVDNTIVNDTNSDIGNAFSIVQANENIPRLEKVTNSVIIPILKSFSKAYYDTAIILKRLFGDRTISGAIRALTGYEQVINANGQAEIQTLSKKRGWDAFRKTNKIDNDAETDFRTGIFSRLSDVRKGYEDVDFIDEKRQLELSIERLLSSKKKEDNDIGGFLKAIYDESVADVYTHDEFVKKYEELYPEEVKSARWVSDNMWKEKAPEFKKHAEENLNETFDDAERDYYHPKSYVKIQERVEVDGPESINGSVSVLNPKETGRSKERTLKGVLPKDKVVDYRFEYNTFKKFQESVFEMESYEAAMTFKYMSKIKGFDSLFGGADNANFVKETYNQQYKLLRYGRRNSDALSNSVGLSMARTARNIGTAIGLGRVTQILTQATPAFNTAIQNPKYFYQVLRAGISPEIKLFDYAIIGARGIEMGAVGRSETTQALSYTKTKRRLEGALTKFSQWTGRNRDRILKPLAATDEAVARKSFLSYYLKYMNEEAGIKTTVEDLSTEHLRMDDTRRMAISYAQQAVDETQGSSGRVMLSQLKRNDNGDTIAEIIKTVVMPFNNFASNTRARIIENGRKIVYGNKAQKVEASMDMLGTTIEATAFAGINAYVLSGVIRFGIKQVFSKVFDIEDEEELNVVLSNKFQQFYTAVTREMILSGFGSGAEQVGTAGLNTLAYGGLNALNWLGFKFAEKSLDETGNDYYTWLKEDPMFKIVQAPSGSQATDVLNNLGGYGIAVNTGLKSWDEVSGAITGETESKYSFQKRTVKPGTESTLYGDVKHDISLRDNERAYFMFMGLLNGATLLSGYSDADIMRSGESLKYDILRGSSKEQYPSKKRKSSSAGFKKSGLGGIKFGKSKL